MPYFIRRRRYSRPNYRARFYVLLVILALATVTFVRTW